MMLLTILLQKLIEISKFFNSFSAQFIAITQGGNKGTCVSILDQNDFSYSFHKKTLQTQYWRCSKRKKFNCSAVIKANKDTILSQTNSHTHAPEDLKNAVSVHLYDDIVQHYFKN